MREEDKGFFRGMSIAGSIAIMCLMLMFAAILKPARRAWSSDQRQPPGDDASAPRDLEAGDPETERRRDSGRDGKSDRGMPHPDEYDVYGNPWNKGSLDSLVGPRSVHMPTPSDLSSDLGGARDDDELPHPDAFVIASQDGENPFADRTPGQSPALDDDEGKDETVDVTERTWIDAWDFAGASSGSSESATTSSAICPSSSSSDEDKQPLPDWLIEPKASAGPRASRLTEVDVDGPTIAAPDFDFLAAQQELLERAPISGRPGVARGATWHPGQDGGEQESSRPSVVRNQTSPV